MANQRFVHKEAFSMVGETCPHIDAALQVAADAIKEQTGALRQALFDALSRAIDAEETVSSLEREIEGLNRALLDARENARS